MTVIQPNKNSKGVLGLILCLSFVLAAMLSLEVLLYSETTSLKYDISRLSEDFDELRITNAELENKFYDTINQNSLEILAEERGLIKEKTPKWVFASDL